MNDLYQIKKLTKDDYYCNFLQLLEQLTIVESDKITYEMFCEQFDKMTSNVFVIKDKSTNLIIASGTLFVETKYIHCLSSVGHIEDIVVDKKYRGLGLGKELVDHLINEGKKAGCYKIILNCNENNIGFYKKCGFKQKEVEMVKYFK